MNRILCSLAVLCVAASTTASAEILDSWKKSVGVGLIITTGNTETQYFNGQIDLSTESEQWRHHVKFDAYSAEEKDVHTGEKYTLFGKSDYKLKNKQFFFVTGTYEDDRFSGFEYQLSGALGYGRRLIDKKDWFIDAEIGPGIRHSKTTTDVTETEGLLRLAANAEWKISKTSTFLQTVSVEIGEESTVTKSETSLSTQIVGNLTFKIAWNIRNQSDVPEGNKETDTRTTANLVYGF